MQCFTTMESADIEQGLLPLHIVLERLRKGDLVIVTSNLNAKLGSNITSFGNVMGRLVDFCKFYLQFT